MAITGFRQAPLGWSGASEGKTATPKGMMKTEALASYPELISS